MSKELGLDSNVSSSMFNEKLLVYLKNRKSGEIYSNKLDLQMMLNAPYSKKLRVQMGINKVKIFNENQYVPIKRWEENWTSQRESQQKPSFMSLKK